MHHGHQTTNTAQYHTFNTSGVVVIGAGFSGMCMAIKLLEEGIEDFVILEKGTGFGGTWKDNAYPGCCCDILSHLYCFSFEQNPNWSRLFPEQEEILDYIRGVARKYDLYKFVRFNSKVTGARWDQDLKQWKVSVQVVGKDAEACEAYTIDTNFLVAGLGQLNDPHWPEIAGESSFKGKIMHSARWDWSYDLHGKRVGIIGNGATAVQIVPEVAKVASHLTIFQRSPNWIIPRMNEDVPKWKRTLLRRVPFLLNRLRATVMDGREAYFRSLIQRNSAESSEIMEFCRNFIKSELPDNPSIWKTLTPNYPPGCKRILLSDDYYSTLRLPNVALETGQIRKITDKGIILKKGPDDDGEEINLDLIIYATGFKTREFTHGIEIYGSEKQLLSNMWANGAFALYGIITEKIPNFGMLYGPNTNLGHNSIILMIEAQTRYILTLIKEVFEARGKGQALSIVPRAEKVKEWNEELQQALASSSFADPKCQSWYKTEDGLVTNNWSGTVIEYQKMISKVDWSDYEISGDPEVEKVLQGKKSIGRVIEETRFGTHTLVATTALSAFAAAAFLLKARKLFYLY